MSKKVSINIKYDLNDTNLLDGYYATKSHASLIKGVLTGSIDEISSKAHIAYGPYGSGKSLISSILTGKLGGFYSDQQLEKLADKFKTTDSQVSDIIRMDSRITYIPILLTGDNGTSIEKSILDALQKKIYEMELSVVVPGAAQSIISKIDLWKKEFPNTYRLFLEELKNIGISISVFKKNVRNSDIDSLNKFNDIHRRLTSGSEMKFNTNQNPFTVLESVLKELDALDYGILIVYDEFGRFLQSLDSSSINKLMEFLQDIAELANNGSKNLTVLFVTHKPVSYYFSNLNRESRSEFAKVEKRYSTYEIKSDYSTFLSISREVLNEMDVNKPSLDIVEEMKVQTNRYSFVEREFSREEIEEVIVKQLFPLHPLSVILLPKLSTVFGQNERTLFTFLEDSSDFGLKGFVNHSEGYYYPDFLTEFFFSTIDGSYTEESKEYEIFKKNYDSLSGYVDKRILEDAQRVYRFIFIWQITKSNTLSRITKSIISYATGIDVKKVERILDSLSRVKKLRFNSIRDEWEIFEGSSLDIQKEIRKVAGNFELQEKDLVLKLNELNPYRYVFSRSFNSEYEMTRFSEIIFITNLDQIGHHNQKSDEESYIFVGKNPSSEQVFGHVNYSLSKIETTVKNIVALDSMMKNNFYKSTYQNVELEFEYEMMRLQNKLSKFYEYLFSNRTQYLEGLRPHSISDLEEYFARQFSDDYNNTLHIVNDQVNMFQMTKIQENALIQVLETVMREGTLECDDIYDGTQPSDLIYFTLIKNIRNIEGNGGVLDLMKHLIDNQIDQNPSGNLFDLISISIRKPFGLRPLTAVFFTLTLLIDKWKDMMLFTNNNFISTISIKELVELLTKSPNSIQYSFSSYDNDNRERLEELESLFGTTSDAVSNKSISIRVCSSMYNWYLELPVITQQMINLGMPEMTLMRFIASSRTNPYESINSIIETFDNTEIGTFKNSIEQSSKGYVFKIVESVFSKSGITDKEEWANQQTQIIKKSNKLVAGILAGTEIVHLYKNDVDNIEISRWTKSSFDALRNMIERDIKETKGEVLYKSIVIDGQEKVVEDTDLSVKGKTVSKNLKNTIDATRKYISDAELESIILALVNDYIR